jgi:hypothetical protein
MHRPAVIAAAFILALSTWSPTPAEAADPQVGSVSRIKPDGEALRDGITVDLASGTAIHQGDEIRTGKGARVEVRLRDETRLTLGEMAKVRVDDFVFDPGRGVGSVTVDSLAGSFRFVSGRLSTMTQKRVAISSTFVTVGIRGTDFWAGPIRGVYGVLLLDGAIEVTAGGVTRTLDNPGQGVDVAAPGAPPGPVVQWAPAKSAEALATVSFTP